MPMTVVVTRDVADRYRGFLASIMPDASPGVSVSPEPSRGVKGAALDRCLRLVDGYAGRLYPVRLEGRCGFGTARLAVSRPSAARVERSGRRAVGSPSGPAGLIRSVARFRGLVPLFDNVKGISLLGPRGSPAHAGIDPFSSR